VWFCSALLSTSLWFTHYLHLWLSEQYQLISVPQKISAKRCKQHWNQPIKEQAFRSLRPWQTRTHCCGHIVADTNVSPFACTGNICCGHKFCVRDRKNVSDFVQKHFVSATNVSQFAQPKKHHEQQCVRNYESSFARAFTGQEPTYKSHPKDYCIN